ncbi:MAG: hypothetical protein KKF46_02330 [Nanoarchaeota archaeon]|nr:hypothetical protein [Nanoarchaeota archaeon]MBU1321169.1 hypothetical protein [Nanoarchaeota archaeon]MBU1598329.1 hypothetical protein [Nanoarchaeota archaeon]MBU2442291.1 hypothetical protein [Nanoarchaeota archaeon]
MNEKRIKEAENNFHSYISEQLLKKEEFNQNIYNRLHQNSLESLRVANEIFKTSFLWTIVTSYYAMFYIASAYIYKKGYKAQHKIVHKVINDALIVLAKNNLKEKLLEEYEEEREKALSIAENLLDNYEYERSKRARFQYEMTEDLKESKAKTSLNRSKEFVEIFRRMLGNI